MKLVEILARALNDWPEVARFARQDIDGVICFEGVHGLPISTEYDFPPGVYASDNRTENNIGTLFITKEEWGKERARITDISRGQESLVTQEHAKDTRAECQKPYEQELWDKVATRLFCEYVAERKNSCYFNENHATQHAFKYVDYFMAERAKRLKERA